LDTYFRLGERYSKPLEATFLDKNGKSRYFQMGTYGIGVSRLLSAIIEQNHDDKGCIWTKESAPFDIHIVVSNVKNRDELAFGEEIYQELKSRGFEVLLDDRKERFGFKMKDYELIGVPVGVIVGKKLKDGKVEIVLRDGLKKIESDRDNLIENILNVV